MKYIQRTCPICKQTFMTVKHNPAQYCGTNCRINANKVESPEDALCKRAAGDVHELLVGVDLMRRGWQAFRNLSAVGAIDLIASQGGTTLRVQVKRGVLRQDGYRYLPHAEGEGKLWDVLAVSYPDGKITYIPELPEAPKS